MMSAVRSSDTKPEMIVRSYLHREGFRYALHSKKLPGRPDIVLVSRKIAIFVNGCFWHGHKNCAGAKLPASNTGFWRGKLSGNAVRDKKNLILLREMGYKVITVWQCDLKSKVREKSLRSLVRKIRVSE